MVITNTIRFTCASAVIFAIVGILTSNNNTPSVVVAFTTPSPTSVTTRTRITTKITKANDNYRPLQLLHVLKAENSNNNNPFAFFGDLLNPNKAPEEELPQYDPVTIANDFRVAALFCVVGGVMDVIPYLQVSVGPVVTALGVLFLVQSFRIRFQFNENNELELVSGSENEVGENKIVGGDNVWSCDSIVNYDFFPPIGSSPIGPILVYFKETQTPSDKWNEGPGKQANDPDKIASGEAVEGQVHFFPAVCNAEQICEEFEKRNCGKL